MVPMPMPSDPTAPSRWTGVGVRRAVLALLGAGLLFALPRWAAGADILLRADGTTALHSGSVPLHLPFGVGLDRLTFEIGFATREAGTAAGFLDALSVSLQPVAEARGAVLVAADAAGTFWLPPNPGGLDGHEAALGYEDRPWPDGISGDWLWSASFSVSLTVPLMWQDCGLLLYADLFDNLNGQASVASLRDVRVTPRSSYFLLESASSPQGPYAVEMGVASEVDGAARAMSLPLGGWARFYRLQADSEVALRMVAPDAAAWHFSYEFPAPEPALEIASRPEGPYTVVTNATLDLAARAFTTPALAAALGPRFYRVRSRVRVAVTGFVREGASWKVRFEYRPRVFNLLSSAQPCGPFAHEPKAEFDTARQVIRVSRREFVRFFRLAQSAERAPVRLRTVERRAQGWRIPYEVMSSPDSP